MKRKAIALLLTAIMAVGLCGCGSNSAPTASDVRENRRQIETSKKNEDVIENKNAVKITSEEENVQNVTFGSKQASGYTGFEYLKEQMVSTTNTKSGQKRTFSVYVPDSDYASVYGASANGSRMGVDFTIDMDPYLGLGTKDYTLEDSLKYYIENDWKYSFGVNYDLSIGDVRSTGDDMAVCEVSYISYDQYEDEYSPVYVIYSIKDMDDGVMALAKVAINCGKTTGKTQDMLAELSSFYELDIGWDASFAETKMAEFEASDEYDPDAYNLGYMSFELPDGWKEVDESSYSAHIFAPNGSMLLSDVLIVVTNDFNVENAVDTLLDDEEATTAYAEAMYSGVGEVDNVSISDFGNTFMGHTAEIRVELTEEDGGDIAFIYIGQNDFDVYQIYLLIYGTADEDEIEGGQAALDMLFETGKIN